MQADTLQSVAFTWVFKLYLTDHITPATGKTVAITISKNTAAFGNPSVGASNATEIANGWYYFTTSTTDTGTLGPLIMLGTCTGCDNADQAYQVIKATNGGMTGIPDAAANANGGLPILSTSGTTLAYTISTLTTYTGNTVQTGDSYARIGATGSGLTSLAPASTALSTSNLPTNFASLAITAAGGVTLADGVAHGGTTATLALQSIAVNAPSGIAIDVQANTVTETIRFKNSGGGSVILIQGGNSGSETVQLDNSTGFALGLYGGINIWPVAGRPTIDIHGSSASGGTAINIAGSGANPGVKISGGPTGHGIMVLGGSISGDAIHLTQTSGFPIYGLLGLPRDVTAVADANLTINDALFCAIGGAAGQQSTSGTTYTVSTPADGTLLRTFTLTLISPPATVPSART